VSHYSRRTYIHHSAEFEPGDLVDISTSLTPYWAAVDRIGACADDEDGEDRCDGDCLGVVFFVDELDAPYHVGESDEVYARLTAEATQDDVDAENKAHAAAAAARYAERLAEATA
jgi:hypothetical protein